MADTTNRMTPEKLEKMIKMWKNNTKEEIAEEIDVSLMTMYKWRTRILRKDPSMIHKLTSATNNKNSIIKDFLSRKNEHISEEGSEELNGKYYKLEEMFRISKFMRDVMTVVSWRLEVEYGDFIETPTSKKTHLYLPEVTYGDKIVVCETVNCLFRLAQSNLHVSVLISSQHKYIIPNKTKLS